MAWRFERVFLVRHGETDWNGSWRRQGQLDSPLTTQGQRSAVVVAGRVVHLYPDGLFSSPLGRARATAEIIGHANRLPVNLEENLAEVHHGVFAGLTDTEIEQRYPGSLVS